MLSVDAYRSPRIDMSSVEWFGRLKWWEILLSGSFSRCTSKCVLFLTFLKCSPNLLFICLDVSPIYRMLHLVQVMQYTTDAEAHVNADRMVKFLFPLVTVVELLMCLRVGKDDGYMEMYQVGR